MAGRKTKAPPLDQSARRIIDETLSLAETEGWENARLFVVAERLGLPLSEVHARFRDQYAVADAWFTMALDAMLDAPRDPAAPAHERMHAALSVWFAALAPHRAVSGQMIRLKLHPPHAHHWVPLVFNLSRLVHWWLDAAAVQGRGPRRAAQEVCGTWLLVTTLRRWVSDEAGQGGAGIAYAGRKLERLAPLFADRETGRDPHP